MSEQLKNPMGEYLLKLQMIITNSEFKDDEEANKYETLDSKLNGEAYVRAVNKTDIFESYQYDGRVVCDMLLKKGYSEDTAFALLKNPAMLPADVKNTLLENAREVLIAKYDEPNKYYVMLSGKPFKGDKNTPADEILLIPDEFYERYASDTRISRSEPIHELPSKYQELFMNSEFYEPMLKKYPDARYLKYIGSNAIPITTARVARDGDIMRINTNKLSTYHPIFGSVTVDASVIHAFSNIYKSTRDYIYQTLRGDFSQIYPNYNSFIRFLTIYMAIGNAMNEFQKKSSKLIYMNNVTANNLFTLYGLPSVIMEGSPMIEFLKKFRLLLMDKGTNVVYRVKDLIGYADTDIYTLVMVKQQVFENGIPIYHIDDDGNKVPKQNIVFRRLGTTDDNTSYFKFRESRKEYNWEEIANGDPRWWNTPEIETMLNEMNYTLSNSKYIQLSTHMSMTDIWWQCVIFIRGILDRKQETFTTLINVNRNINGSSTMSVFEAVLCLVVMMNWQMIDYKGDNFDGEMYIPTNGNVECIDMLFNGLDINGAPNELKPGLPFKIASFNFDIRDNNPNAYQAMYTYEYLEPDVFMPMLNTVLDMESTNVGEVLMTNVRLIYKYLEDKLRSTRTIHQFRQVTETYKALFLVDPIRQWHDNSDIDTDELLCEKYNITSVELESFKTFFKAPGSYTVDGEPVEPDFTITYNKKQYDIYLYNILNNNVYDTEYDGEYLFRNHTFVQIFNAKVNNMTKAQNIEIQRSMLSQTIKDNYKRIIIDKVNIDLGSSKYGPTSFENLLMIENPSLYEYLVESREDGNDNIILLMRSIIKALETYANASLSALECKALGIEQYFYILKEVITYFKSYMVEFTQDEFTYIFDGIFDNGGNSNMLKLFDEIVSGEIDVTPVDSISLFDVSHGEITTNLDDTFNVYDDVLFRVKATYKDFVETGYEIWYDDGKRITQTPFKIDDDTELVANIVSSNTDNAVAYKIIININNLDVVPPNYYGTAR